MELFANNLSFLLFILLMYSEIVQCSFCLWGDDSYKYLSTKTPYNFIRGDIGNSYIKIQGCEPISIWALIRHGKRNPSTNFAIKMKEALSLRDLITASHEGGKSSLCSQDIENLRNWPMDENMFDGNNFLSKDGYKEMVEIGSRLNHAFHNLLTDIDDISYTIKAAFGSRMVDSAKGLAEGLNRNTTKIEESNSNYDELAPYTTCGKYQRDVKTSPNKYLEEIRYLKGKMFYDVKTGLQKRLGIDRNLTNDNIIALYDLCRYTWSGYANISSPWCTLFTIEDLKILEYDDDLRLYYRNGYGTPMNRIFGRILLANLLNRFQDSRQGRGKLFTGYITHSSMLDMTYTALGLFEDEEPLTGEKIDPNRKWRSTFLSTFGANIISVLNRCNNSEHKVVFYRNEKPLSSICNDGVCTWKEFEAKLKPFVNTSIDFCEFKTNLYN